MTTKYMVTHASKCFRVPPPFMVPGLIRHDALHLINADAFTGKSALATGIAVSVATGTPLFEGSPPCDYGRVLFFALDAPDWDYGTLLSKVCTQKGLSQRDLEEGEAPLFYVFRDQGANIESRSQMERYILEASDPSEGVPPDLIIVDTMLSIHEREESDAVAMKQVMRAFTHFKGSAWLILHHNAKSPLLSGAAKSRGSTVIPGSVDMQLSIKRGRRKKGEGLAISGEWVKGRGGDLPEKMSYTMTWDDRVLAFHIPPEQVDRRALFLARLDPKKKYAWNELQGLAGVSPSELKLWIKGTPWEKT
jgi:RecA-family ATPase